MPKPSKTHKLSSGERVTVERAYIDGFTDMESCITIDSRIKSGSKLHLDVLIHECLHCEFPDMSEEDVLRSATSIARLLWYQSWRLKP